MQVTFFTPSYIGDLDRAIWMRRSLRKFFQGEVRHLISVPKKDMHQFQLALDDDESVEIVSQEEVVSKAFYPDLFYRLIEKVAKNQLWRLEKHAGRPGWIVQQIVKLSCSHWIKSGAVVMIDSDLIFMRPFNLHDLGLAEKVFPLVKITPKDEQSRHRNHIDNSRTILGLSAGPSEHHYMGYPTLWNVAWLKELQHYLSKHSGKSWQSALLDARHISEYTIYGIFVEEILKPVELSLITYPFHQIAWDIDSFNQIRKTALAGKKHDAQLLSLVIQSNLEIPPSEYEDMLNYILNQQTR